MHLGEAELKNFLLDTGLVSRGALADAAQRANTAGLPLSRVLIESGVLSEDEVRRAAAHALGVPFVKLDRHSVALEALVLIPEPLARSRGVVGFALSDRGLEVALLDLADLEVLEFLRPQYKVLPRLTTRDSMTQVLLHYQKHLRDKFGKQIEDETQIADALLLHALHSNAQEIVLDSTDERVVVRYRIHGALHEALALPQQKGVALLQQFKSHAKLFPVRKIQDGRFKIEKDGQKIGVRLSCMPTVTGERIVLHLVRNDERKGYTLESLGLHGEQLEVLHEALLKKKGVLVVAGPQGAGKTTLLYTMLDMLSAPHHAIATVERTVEHALPRVAQAEIKEGESPAGLLRAALRQDPDILMVGDVRDRETAALTVRAASRGVFVLLDVEAANAAEAIDKLRRLGVDPAVLGSTVVAAVGVRSLRLLCDKQFTEKYKLSRAEADQLEEDADFVRVLQALKEEGRVEKGTSWKELTFAAPVPCAACEHGYKGRTSAFEVLHITPAIKDVIKEGKGVEDIESQARKEGMLNVIEDAMFKAAGGSISIKELLEEW